jgi:sortase A
VKILPAAKFASRLVALGEHVFLLIGIVALAYWASVSVNARLFQRKEARRFAEELQTQPVSEKKDAPSQPSAEVEQQAPVEGAVVAILAIPRIGLSTVVVEGVKDRDLKLGAGHIPGTAQAGQPGNVGIAGHRDTFFRPLRLIRKDDVVALTTLHERDQYRVVSTQIVDPDDVQVLYPKSRDTLTLVTCYPFYYVGAAPKRFIVRAEREKTPTNKSGPSAL